MHGSTLELLVDDKLVHGPITILTQEAEPMRVWLVPLVYQIERRSYRLSPTQIVDFKIALDVKLKSMTPLTQTIQGVEINLLPLTEPVIYSVDNNNHPLTGGAIWNEQRRIRESTRIWGNFQKTFWKEKHIKEKILPSNPNLLHSDWIVLLVPVVRHVNGTVLPPLPNNTVPQHIAGICPFNEHLPVFFATQVTQVRKPEDVAVHEIGHGHGLRHVQTDSNNPEGTTKEFPYHPIGNIGVQGWDKDKQNKIITYQTSDLMTYVSTRWLSDYHYERWWHYDKNVYRGPIDLVDPIVIMTTNEYQYDHETTENLTNYIQIPNSITIKYEVTDNKPNPILDIEFGNQKRTLTGNNPEITITLDELINLRFPKGMSNGFQVIATPRDVAGNTGVPSISRIFWIEE